MFADNKIRKIQQVDAIYLDFAKAGFNRVNHKLLLKKIHRFGICGTLLSWFDLTGGLTVLGVNFKSLPVLSGVPQGSIRSTLVPHICK